MPTLKHFLGIATHSKGRRFRWHGWKDDEWFEPLQKSALGVWKGIDEDGDAIFFEDDGDDNDAWDEISPSTEPREWWVTLSHEDSRIYYSTYPNHYKPGPGWIKVREVTDEN